MKEIFLCLNGLKSSRKKLKKTIKIKNLSIYDNLEKNLTTIQNNKLKKNIFLIFNKIKIPTL